MGKGGWKNYRATHFECAARLIAQSSHACKNENGKTILKQIVRRGDRGGGGKIIKSEIKTRKLCVQQRHMLLG